MKTSPIFLLDIGPTIKWKYFGIVGIGKQQATSRGKCQRMGGNLPSIKKLILFGLFPDNIPPTAYNPVVKALLLHLVLLLDVYCIKFCYI